MKNTRRQGLSPILVLLAVLIFTANSIFIGATLTKRYERTDKISTAPYSESPTITPSDPSLTSNISNNAPARLAWFTSLPKNTDDLLSVSNWFDLFILIQGDEERRDFIKNSNVSGAILQYVEFETIQDPGSCIAEPEINQVAYKPGDFCKISEQHPDWFLLDRSGNRIYTTDDGNTWYLMDPGNPGWQNFFLERIKDFQSDPGWNGVFLDNVPVTLAFREDEQNIPAAYPDDLSYQSAIRYFLRYLFIEYFQPNSKLLFANLVARRDDSGWANYLPYLDGAMYEGWSLDWPNGYRSTEDWERQMKIAEHTQQAGKYIILVSQGKEEDLPLQKFAFASYLLINQGRAFFRYSNSSSYSEIWLYDNYSINLGEPLGPRYQVELEWKRDFARGSVIVNPVTQEAEIIVND